MNPADLDAIAVVKSLIHRVNGRRDCKCEECRAIRRVCGIAVERVQNRKPSIFEEVFGSERPRSIFDR